MPLGRLSLKANKNICVGICFPSNSGKVCVVRLSVCLTSPLMKTLIPQNKSYKRNCLVPAFIIQIPIVKSFF